MSIVLRCENDSGPSKRVNGHIIALAYWTRGFSVTKMLQLLNTIFWFQNLYFVREKNDFLFPGADISGHSVPLCLSAWKQYLGGTTQNRAAGVVNASGVSAARRGRWSGERIGRPISNVATDWFNSFFFRRPLPSRWFFKRKRKIIRIASMS